MHRNFTQTEEYLRWHEGAGHEVFKYEDKNGEGVYAYGVVVKSNFGKILYFPYGPEKISEDLILSAEKFATETGCFFIRMETEDDRDWGLAENKSFAKNFYFPPSKFFLKDGYLQPRVEWWLDISGNEEEIYNDFSKNHRYSVRKAEKEGVEIEIFEKSLRGSEYEKIFLEIIKETAKRDNFLMPDEKYLKAILESIESGNNGGGGPRGFLAFSKLAGEYNAVALVLYYEGMANFIYGGSTNFRRESGATVKLQFECIKKARELGARIYNFGGIYEKGLAKTSLQPLTRFKKQFGERLRGRVKYHGGFADLPINRPKYFVYLFYKILISLLN